MSFEMLLDRNKAFAATDAVAKNPKIPWLPASCPTSSPASTRARQDGEPGAGHQWPDADPRRNPRRGASTGRAARARRTWPGGADGRQRDPGMAQQASRPALQQRAARHRTARRPGSRQAVRGGTHRPQEGHSPAHRSAPRRHSHRRCGQTREYLFPLRPGAVPRNPNPCGAVPPPAERSACRGRGGTGPPGPRWRPTRRPRQRRGARPRPGSTPGVPGRSRPVPGRKTRPPDHADRVTPAHPGGSEAGLTEGPKERDTRPTPGRHAGNSCAAGEPAGPSSSRQAARP